MPINRAVSSTAPCHGLETSAYSRRFGGAYALISLSRLPAVRKDICKTRILGPRRRTTAENCARYNQYIHACPVLGAYNFDQHASERRNCNIDQVPHGEVRGLENADHRSNFKIDEQEEDVSEARATLGGHSDERCSR